MITELRVRDLGVIESVDLLLGSGLTVITGETGAGKTLVVEALQLLLGARADSNVVRSGASECRVEGRFGAGDDEIILARVVPAGGRSRAYIDDRMTPVQSLEEAGRDLVDLHGQHDHHTLLRAQAQRAALDHFAGVDLAPLSELRAQLRELDGQLDAVGGDNRNRDRQLDLLRFERDEIAAASIAHAGELEELREEETRLASATALREASSGAYERLSGEDGALDQLGAAVEATDRLGGLGEHAARLRGLVAEVADAAAELRAASERFEENPERLAAIQERRAELGRLVRKHGGDLADVLAAFELADREIAALEGADETRRVLLERRDELLGEIAAAEKVVGDQRRAAAAPLARAVAEHFGELALANATLHVEVPATGPGDEVEFQLQANLGEARLALSKVASGGELARVMLALRLVLSTAPPTLVFDEVDAGIGGGVGLAIGRALAALADTRQVLVVTHLAQVAAFADHHLVVEKTVNRGRTRSSVRAVHEDERVIELSRMLSGQPDSQSARTHASELLSLAQRGEQVRAGTSDRL